MLTLLQQGDLAAAAQLAEKHALPRSQARVQLAQGEPAKAIAELTSFREQVGDDRLPSERLKVLVLLAVAHHAHGETDKAVQILGEARVLAKPHDFIRLFVDEGPPMKTLLREAAKRGITPNYVGQLRAAFGEDEAGGKTAVSQPLIAPLSERELEVLKLLGTDLSGPEIAHQLMVSLNTLRTHTKNIYTKLGVNNRRTAVRRAKELGLS